MRPWRRYLASGKEKPSLPDKRTVNAYVRNPPCHNPARLGSAQFYAPRHALPGRIISSLLRHHIQDTAGRLR